MLVREELQFGWRSEPASPIFSWRFSSHNGLTSNGNDNVYRRPSVRLVVLAITGFVSTTISVNCNCKIESRIWPHVPIKGDHCHVIIPTAQSLLFSWDCRHYWSIPEPYTQWISLLLRSLCYILVNFGAIGIYGDSGSVSVLHNPTFVSNVRLDGWLTTLLYELLLLLANTKRHAAFPVDRGP